MCQVGFKPLSYILGRVNLKPPILMHFRFVCSHYTFMQPAPPPPSEQKKEKDRFIQRPDFRARYSDRSDNGHWNRRKGGSFRFVIWFFQLFLVRFTFYAGTKPRRLLMTIIANSKIGNARRQLNEWSGVYRSINQVLNREWKRIVFNG